MRADPNPTFGSEADIRFGARALDRGLLDFPALQRALDELGRRRLAGDSVTLPDLLIERGLLDPDAADDLERSVADSMARTDRQATTDRLGAPDSPAPRPDVWLSGPRPAAERTFGRYLDPVEVARGGLGSVLRAVDPRLNRPVALKILRSSGRRHAAYKTSLFLKEAQVTGQLSHPNIVPVYELGEAPDGAPFLAMKLVDGKTLDAVLAGEGRGRRRGEALARRLGEFLKVCDAIAFAHSRGVIHRDLKPSNVMIGEFGEVLVLDWGVAKIRGLPDDHRGSLEVDRSARPAGDSSPLATVDGTVLGTPAYMSPEQAEGDVDRIDERSDVYGLGAILYEILTGTAPFPGTNAWAVLNQVSDGRLEPPGARAPRAGVAPELEAVVLRAMARRPADRYASAGELAADVEAWLAGRTLQAFRYRPWHRAAKFVRRHRAASLAAAAVVAAIASLAAYQRWDAGRERAERVRDALAEADGFLSGAPEGPEAALEARLRAANALDRALATEPDHAGARERRRAVGLELGRTATAAGDYTLARQAFLDLARFDLPAADVEALLEEVAAAREGELRRREARLEAILADLSAGLSRPDRSPVEPGLDDLVFEAAGFRDERSVAALARALDAYAAGPQPVSWTEDESIVVRFLCRSLARLGAFVPSAVDPLARWLAAVRDGDLAVEAAKALCQTRRPSALTPLLAARERFESNSSVWRRIEPWLRLVPRPDVSAEPSGAVEWAERGRLSREFGDRAGALADYGRALELDPGLVLAWVNRGILRYELDDPAGAESDLDRAIELGPSIGIAHAWRGIVRWKRGDLARARVDLDRGLELDPGNASALHARANVRRETGDLAGALADYARAIPLDPENADLFNNRGLARRRSGDLAGAIEDHTEALRIDPRFAGALVNRGLARADRGELDAAIDDFSRALEIEPRLVEAYTNRGNARSDCGDHAGAVDDLSRGHDLAPERATILHDRALAHLKAGDLRSAVADYDRYLAVEPRDAGARNNRGRCRQELGDAAGAIEDFGVAIEVEPDQPGFRANRGYARLISGDLDGAIEDYGVAIELDPGEAGHRVNRGAARLRKGDARGAMPDYDRAIELDPDLVEGWTDRGAARLMLGDAEGALADYEVALRLDPDGWLTWTKYGLLLGELRRTEEALEALGKARERAPESQRRAIEDQIARIGRGRR